MPTAPDNSGATMIKVGLYESVAADDDQFLHAPEHKTAYDTEQNRAFLKGSIQDLIKYFNENVKVGEESIFKTSPARIYSVGKVAMAVTAFNSKHGATASPSQFKNKTPAELVTAVNVHALKRIYEISIKAGTTSPSPQAEESAKSPKSMCKSKVKQLASWFNNLNSAPPSHTAAPTPLKTSSSGIAYQVTANGFAKTPINNEPLFCLQPADITAEESAYKEKIRKAEVVFEKPNLVRYLRGSLKPNLSLSKPNCVKIRFSKSSLIIKWKRCEDMSNTSATEDDSHDLAHATSFLDDFKSTHEEKKCAEQAAKQSRKKKVSFAINVTILNPSLKRRKNMYDAAFCIESMLPPRKKCRLEPEYFTQAALQHPGLGKLCYQWLNCENKNAVAADTTANDSKTNFIDTASREANDLNITRKNTIASEDSATESIPQSPDSSFTIQLHRESTMNVTQILQSSSIYSESDNESKHMHTQHCFSFRATKLFNFAKKMFCKCVRSGQANRRNEHNIYELLNAKEFCSENEFPDAELSNTYVRCMSYSFLSLFAADSDNITEEPTENL